MEKNLSINDLQMYPTHDLLEEVFRRCSPVVFIGTAYEGETGDRSWKNFSRWAGNLDTCRGMCHEMDSLLQRELMRQENERAFGEED